MIIAGIIAEYNPFHKGHQYHIEQTRKVTGADYVIAVMSPDFVQRGTPALMDKHTRAKMALQGGADLVIELPVNYACSSAEYFTTGGVVLLDSLQAVNFLSFGSECGDIDALMKLGYALYDESDKFQDTLKAELKKGASFPVARKRALSQELPEYADILDSPNNILATEYCMSIINHHSHLKPVTIRRSADNYHDTTLSEEHSSASAIRATLLADEKILSGGDMTIDDMLDDVQDDIPAGAFETLKGNWAINGPLCEDGFSSQLKYKLLSETAETLTSYLDVSESLANRIIKSLNKFESFSQFAELLKSKDLTRTRINRALLHILLNIKDVQPIEYARILGFRKSAEPLLSAIKKSSSIPLVTKLSEVAYDVFATNLYESVLSEKYARSFVHEYSKPVVIV